MTTDKNKLLIIAVSAVAILLIAFSSMLAPYKDASLVHAAQTMNYKDFPSPHAASQKYWAIRDSQLTPKYLLEDYGFLLLQVALMLIIARWIFKIRTAHDLLYLRTPSRYFMVVLTGIAASVILYGTFTLSLFLDLSRDLYPPWGDSISISLMGIFALMPLVLIGVGLFAVAGYPHVQKGVLIANAFKKGLRPRWIWMLMFGIPFVVSSVGAISSLAFGDQFSFSWCLLGTLFFLFLFAGRQRHSVSVPCVR